MGRLSTRRPVVRLRVDAEPVRVPDTVAVEEPLELRVAGHSLALTMRTPGHDMDLAAGFLVAEGMVAAACDIATMRFCAGTDDAGEQTYNLLDIALAAGVVAPVADARPRLTTSACGLCAKDSIEAVRARGRYDVSGDPLRLDPAVVAALPDRLRERQRTFATTGGLHAAGLIDGVSGDLLVVREDVGRHNAVDKVVGWALREGRLPLRGTVLVVSGRASFELTQKAVAAGCPALVAVSAPSSLAVDLAVEAGLTLVGFARGQSAVVYSRADRVVSTAGR